MINKKKLKDAAIHTLLYVCGVDAISLYTEGDPLETYKTKSKQVK